MQTNIVYNKSSLIMDEVENNSVDTVITSPPYWGLRDYGEGANQIWDGDPECEHQWGNKLVVRERGSATGLTAQVRNQKNPKIAKTHSTRGQFCQLCGAWYGQLGLEPTLEMYIEHLLLITAECKRVLKPTGVMWWNHADCYFTGKGSCNNPGGGPKSWKSWNDRKAIFPRGRGAPNRMSKEIPAKCLALQNFRLIIRLIDEQGWVLRNTAIWNKPNSMPSSTKDRLTNKYEPVFFLIKNTKSQYYWNEKAGLMANRKSSPLQENVDWEWIECPKCEGKGKISFNDKSTKITEETAEDYSSPRARYHRNSGEGICSRCKGTKKIKHSFWHSLDYWFDLDIIREKHKENSKKRYNYSLEGSYTPGNVYPNEKREKPQHYNPESLKSVGKNPGDVWTIPTQPYPEAHFATFPEKLTIKPILSSCPAEICRKCGKARVRITKPSKEYAELLGTWTKDTDKDKNLRANIGFQAHTKKIATTAQYQTIGWSDCGCNAGWRPGIILDPFAGRGTTLAMAKRLGRQFIGYEIVKSYIPLIRKSLEKEDTMFNRDLKEQFV